MGSGKTTYGKKLAQLFGYPFIDLDHLIEEEQGKSIPEIFQQIGENGFRKLEHQFLKTYTFPHPAIISCGGGTPCFYDNMQIINNLGVSVYLYTNAKTLSQRLASGKANRPLIKDLSDEELYQFIEQKVRERNPFYQQAAITVDTVKSDAAKMKIYIEEFLNNNL